MRRPVRRAPGTRPPLDTARQGRVDGRVPREPWAPRRRSRRAEVTRDAVIERRLPSDDRREVERREQRGAPIAAAGRGVAHPRSSSERRPPRRGRRGSVTAPRRPDEEFTTTRRTSAACRIRMTARPLPACLRPSADSPTPSARRQDERERPPRPAQHLSAKRWWMWIASGVVDPLPEGAHPPRGDAGERRLHHVVDEDAEDEKSAWPARPADPSRPSLP
jgi:hypothetical protein